MALRLSISPHGLEEVCRKLVFIPNNSAAPGSGGQWYDLDMTPLLIWTDESLDMIAASAASYLFTLSVFADLTDAMLKSVSATMIERSVAGKTKTEIKEFDLPRDLDYANLLAQASWLRNCVNVIERSVIPLCQTLSANRRPKGSAYLRTPSSGEIS